MTDYRVCWWCGGPFPETELLRLEGARLLGGPPVVLPRHRMTAREREDAAVCHACAVSLALVRRRLEIEPLSSELLRDAPLELAPAEMTRLERTHGTTVVERLRKMLSEHKEIG